MILLALFSLLCVNAVRKMEKMYIFDFFKKRNVLDFSYSLSEG